MKDKIKKTMYIVINTDKKPLLIDTIFDNKLDAEIYIRNTDSSNKTIVTAPMIKTLLTHKYINTDDEIIKYLNSIGLSNPYNYGIHSGVFDFIADRYTKLIEQNMLQKQKIQKLENELDITKKTANMYKEKYMKLKQAAIDILTEGE